MSPFKSKSQQRYFFSAESRGELPKGTALQWAREPPNIKALPDKKKKTVKKAFTQMPQNAAVNTQQRLQRPNNIRKPLALAQFSTLPNLMKNNIPSPTAKQAGVFKDTGNALWGTDGLERLNSWNRVKGYLPGFARDHITKKHVNPAIWDFFKKKGMLALGLLGGVGLGAYGLYRGFSQPKKEEAPPDTSTRIPSLQELTTPLRTVNENLGLTIDGKRRQ